jgi:hypothetical protein
MGSARAVFAGDTKVVSSRDNKKWGPRTDESARSSGLPAAIAKSPAVTVRVRSS